MVAGRGQLSTDPTYQTPAAVGVFYRFNSLNNPINQPSISEAIAQLYFWLLAFPSTFAINPDKDLKLCQKSKQKHS